MSEKLLKVRRRGVRGLSLLEIMIAIVVLTAALMSFASVFPAAFKVSRYAGNYSRAEKCAAGIVEELRNLKFRGNTVNYKDADGNVNLGFIEAYTDGSKDIRDNINKLNSVKALQEANSKFNTKFKLGDNNIIHIKDTFCTFTVTICWKEQTRDGKEFNRSVTVVGGRTGRRI